MISKMSLQQLEDNFLAFILMTFYHASFATTPLTSERSIMRTPINGCDDCLDAMIVIQGAASKTTSFSTTLTQWTTAIHGATMSPGADATHHVIATSKTCLPSLPGTRRQGSTTSQAAAPGEDSFSTPRDQYFGYPLPWSTGLLPASCGHSPPPLLTKPSPPLLS